MATNWPITAADLRKALEYEVAQDDATELALYAAAACERIDRDTGRLDEPGRHEVGGKLPVIFVLAARRTARLWWNQDHKGPRARPNSEDLGDGIRGIDLPRSVQGMLEGYPPRPGFGAATS